MQLYNLKCPSCGAELEMKDNISAFYCQYCGAKLILDGQSKELLEAKVKVHDLDLQYKERKEIREERQKQEDKGARQLLIIAIVSFLFALGLLLLMRTGTFSYRNMLKMIFWG